MSLAESAEKNFNVQQKAPRGAGFFVAQGRVFFTSFFACPVEFPRERDYSTGVLSFFRVFVIGSF